MDSRQSENTPISIDSCRIASKDSMHFLESKSTTGKSEAAFAAAALETLH